MTSTRIAPTSNNILIRIDSPPAKTAGGLYVPQTVQAKEQKKTARGTVLAVGPGKPNPKWPGEVLPIDPRIRVGAQVIFNLFKGQDVPDWENCRLIDDGDVTAILEVQET